ASVVQGIAEDHSGIGYSGIGYRTSDVKTVALSSEKGKKAFPPTYENVLSRDYPLGRLLYVYIAKEPGKPVDPLVGELIKFVLSKEGQEVVVKDGYLPLPASAAER